MKVSSLIRGKAVETIGPSASIEELTTQLKRHNVGALVVQQDGKIDGIVSERDIVRAMPGNLESLPKLKVRDLMSTRVLTCSEETTISELMATMTEKRIRHVPVVDSEGRLLSIVSIGDIMKSYSDEVNEERKALEGYIVGG